MSESKLFEDHHTHTVFSHGKGTIVENVAAAAAAGIRTIGIADHGPGHVGFGMKLEDVPQMRAEIALAQEQHPEMQVLLNVEANIINYSGHLDVSSEDQKLFDRIIAGYHRGVFGEEPVRAFFTHIGSCWYGLTSGSTAHRRVLNTELVIRALEQNRIFMLSHPGSKAAFDLRCIAEACAACGTLLEINSHHDGLSAEGIRIAAECGAGLLISSDAHRPEQVGRSGRAIGRAEEAGIPSSLILNLKEEARWN